MIKPVSELQSRRRRQMQAIFWQTKGFRCLNLKYKSRRRWAEIKTTVESSSHAWSFISRLKCCRKKRKLSAIFCPCTHIEFQPWISECRHRNKFTPQISADATTVSCFGVWKAQNLYPNSSGLGINCMCEKPLKTYDIFILMLIGGFHGAFCSLSFACDLKKAIKHNNNSSKSESEINKYIWWQRLSSDFFSILNNLLAYSPKLIFNSFQPRAKLLNNTNSHKGSHIITF